MSKTAHLYAATIAIATLFACLPAGAQGELGGLKGIGGMGGGCKGIGGMGGGFKGIGGMGGGCKGLGGMGGGFRGVGDAGGGFDQVKSNYYSRYQTPSRYGITNNSSVGRYGIPTNNYNSGYGNSGYGYRFGGSRFGNQYGDENESEFRSPATTMASLEALQRLRAVRETSRYYAAPTQTAAYYNQGNIWQTVRRNKQAALPATTTGMVGNPDSMGGFRMYSENP